MKSSLRGMRRNASLAGFAIAGIILAGCASASGGGASASGGGATDEVTTIQLWGRDSTAAFLQPLAEAFNASQSKIHVETTIIAGVGEFDLKFASGIAAGDVPDVTSLDLVAVAQYARNGALLDITDRVAKIDYLDDFDSAHLGTVTWDGKYYALPFNAEASVLYYNKDLFEAAGLDPESPPQTWKEIADDAAAITALGGGNYGFYMSGNCGGCNLFVVTPYLTAAGADILTAGDTAANVDFNSQPVIGALEFLNGMWKNGDMPEDAKSDTGANFYSTFATGTIGMQGGGAFGIGDLIENGTVNFGTTFLPGPEKGQRSSFAGGDDIVIPTASKHPEEAWEFVKWATSVEAQTILADLAITPVRTSVATGYYAAKDPRLATLAEALQLGKTQMGPDVYAVFNSTGSPWVGLLQDGIFGDDPAAAAEVAQQEALKVLTTN